MNLSKQKQTKRIRALMLPAVIIVAIISQVPFLVTIVLSLIRWNIRRPDIPISFSGVDNYLFIFRDRDFYAVLKNTALIALLGVVFCLVLAFMLALLFNRKFKGIFIARSLLILPYFVMEPVIGILWKSLMLSPSFGLNQVICSFLGLEPISFFNSQNSLMTIIILIIWQWTPFIFMILLSGLQNIPEEVIESAKLDGAQAWNMVFRIKIPLIKGYFEVAAMFGLINILKVFGLIFVTTQGGPGVSSANLPYYVYRTAFYDWQVGRSSAIAVIMVIITLLAINIFMRMMKRSQKVAE